MNDNSRDVEKDDKKLVKPIKLKQEYLKQECQKIQSHSYESQLEGES